MNKILHEVKTMKLKEARFNKRMSQMRLFLVTGIWPSKISCIENDLINPTADEKRKLAEALGYSQEWLFPREEKRSEKFSEGTKEGEGNDHR